VKRQSVHADPRSADTVGVRGVGLLVLLISLAVVGGLTMTQGKSQGPTSAAATQEESLALTTAAESPFPTPKMESRKFSEQSTKPRR
jgi:hypothetical protein